MPDSLQSGGLLVVGTGAQLVRKAGIPANASNAGLIEASDWTTEELLGACEQALPQHRHFAREGLYSQLSRRLRVRQ